jgi:antitoxin (DNA-binding transcriptional repressor) of toxin-antitoxin stability system
MAEQPRVVRSAEARKHIRDLLDDAERGVHTEVRRYDRPVAVLVPPDWYEKAIEALKHTK